MSKTEKSENSAQRFVTPVHVVSFPHVFTPSAMKGADKKKYSYVGLFKKSVDMSGFKLAIKHAKIDKFGPNKAEWPEDLESPIQDGDQFPDREGYPGHWVVKFSSNEEYKPTIVDENVEEIMNPKEFYPGCKAKAQVYCRVWEFGNKMGIHFILDMAQKVGDGKPFTSRKSAKEVFAPLGADASDTDDSDDEGDDDNF